MSFDEGGVYYSYQHAENQEAGTENNRTKIIGLFKDFLNNHFNVGRANTDAELVYRQRLNKETGTLLVDLVHVKDHDAELGDSLEQDPSYYLPLFERAAKEVLQEDHQLNADGAERHFEDVQIMLFSSSQFGPASMRDLTSARVMKLVQLPGIITAASKPKHKATYITIQCKDCRNKQTIPCLPGMGGAMIPRVCTLNQGAQAPQERCSLGPFVVLGDSSSYVDQQTLKLQERPEDIPTGELPRTLLCVADRHLVNRVTPGTRVTITGMYCTHRSSAMEKGASVTLQQPYLRIVGIQEQTEGHKADAFTNEDIGEFLQYARQAEVHEDIFKRIAPKIFGTRGSSVDDIKKAIACLLFGGARKVMPDGTTRRGDINVLLLGDPSTAKSQFLKFADKVAPISVYTSGKGSSAAGLTAAVVQDPNSREFYLEGGAMVLADGGVVCIDEFDKMRPEDRVAIHEAMEQQTISIAKAGITTVLKSRTSVLAAANPPSGRYDDLRSTAENIDLQSTVLSRFDLIFIVRDSAEPEKDMAIARHVLQVHQRANAAQPEGAADKEEEERWFKRYIHYCRTHCFPRLNDEARHMLTAKYVHLRSEARKAARSSDTEEPPIPITVRQLEALVRISEALARMQLMAEATPDHVEVAYKLFEASTMNAMNAGLISNTLGQQEETATTQAVEGLIKDRVARGGHISFQRLMDEIVARGYSRAAVGAAVRVMELRGELRRKAEGKLLQRTQR